MQLSSLVAPNTESKRRVKRIIRLWIYKSLHATKRKSLGYKKWLSPFVPGELEHFVNIKCRSKEAGMGHWKVENRGKYVEVR